MMQFHPHQRLCIADIIGHPWLASGEVATAEEVREEFRQRHEVNKQRSREEEDRKIAQRNQVNAGTRRDFQLEGKVYLGHEDQAPEDADPTKIYRLNIKEYDGDENGFTQAFFSHFRPDYLFAELTMKMAQ